MACFGPISVISFIFLSVQPLFYSVTVLLVVFPLSDVFGSVRVRVGSFSICFIVIPLSFVDIAIRVVESALPTGLVLFPLSFVPAWVRPHLHSFPMFHALQPLAVIGYAILQFYLFDFYDGIDFHGTLNYLIVFLAFALPQKIVTIVNSGNRFDW